MSSPSKYRNYRDLEQVAPFVDRYFAIFTELQAIPVFGYNDLFKHRIPGIEGPGEDSAIYLLQTIRGKLEDLAKVNAALADGCSPIETVTEKTKFHRVVHYGWQNGEDGYREWEDARLVPYENGRQTIMAVLPKGKRTYGTPLTGKVLVK